MFRGRTGRRPKAKPHEEFDGHGDPYGEDVEEGHRTHERASQNLRIAADASGATFNALGINRSRMRGLDLRWKEKLWAFIDALQVFALLWSLSQPWPWPRPWLSATRLTVVVNLDMVSLFDAAMEVTGTGVSSSPWGELEGYVYYAVVMTLVPVALQALWYFRKMLSLLWLDRGVVACCRFAFGRRKRNPAFSLVMSALVAFERMLLLAAHLLYLPVVLAVIRLVLCDDDGTLSVDPSMSCRSPALILPTMCGIVVVVFFTVGLKKHTTEAVHAVTTYRDRVDHERFLQRVEIEYALDLCNAWATDHLWMVSSFRRHAVKYRVHMMYFKLVLALVYAFGRSDLPTQAVIFWGVMTAWTASTCIHLPYRCRSSNRLHIALYATLWTTSLLGMMTGYGVRSPMLVARTQFRWLVVINFIGAVVAIGVVVVTPIEEALERRRKASQAAKGLSISTTNPADPEGGEERSTGDRSNISDRPPAMVVLLYPDRWPTRATLEAMARLPGRKEWVSAIRRTRDFRHKCETCPVGLEPIRSVEVFMRYIRGLWTEAKKADSALEPALSSALERLALAHARMLKAAGGRESGLTYILEETLLDKGVWAGMLRRKGAQVLMDDRQKRVMLKVMAVSAFLNHRDFRYSTPESIDRLQNDTKWVLSQPLTSESRASLKNMCMQWKRLIQKSERDFEEANGHSPLPSDKEAHEEWYEWYRNLRTTLSNLPISESDGRRVSLHAGGDIQRDYPESLTLTPAASDSQLVLIRATEQLLANANSPKGDTEIIEAETCRKQWKRIIRRWEVDFKERTGVPPEVSDKQVVRSYFEYYQRLGNYLAPKELN